MPYQPFDTGWIQLIYSTICLGWFLLSTGLFPRFTCYSLYNNVYIPFSKVAVSLCEFFGNVGLLFGKRIIHYEAIVFQHVNYITPIYNVIKYIERCIPTFRGGKPPSSKYLPSNVRLRHTSSGKHLARYYALKRRRRNKQVIFPSEEYYIRPKHNNNQGTNESRKSTPVNNTVENTYDFNTFDDMSCQDNEWYDAISPYWTGGMVWGGA
jgi:hypothetical protein